MADRIHPHDSPSADADADTSPLSMSSDPLLSDHSTISGTYVIQLPKDQIYRLPAPENAKLFEKYTRRGKRPRRSLRTCFITISATILALITILAITLGVLFLVLRPHVPRYSVDSLSIKSFNATSDPQAAAQFVATVRADNPNKKIAVRYRDGSDVTVSYAGVPLAEGVWPAFLQGERNVTVFGVVLRGSGVRLAGDVVRRLVKDQGRGAVPLTLDVRVPVRVEFGAVKSWTVTVKVRCDVTVDKLTVKSRVVSKRCRSKVHLS